jgi:hypothetical protein
VPIRKSAFFAVALACILPLAAQAATTPHWVHYKLLNHTIELPKKLVILPLNVKVLEVTAGGVTETVPEWTAEARKNIKKSLTNAIKDDATLSEVKMPRLSTRDAALVDEHVALYNLVTNTASHINWEHKIRRFDYSIGPGLAKLRRKTGADAAVMVYARDYASTTGRKAKAILGRIPIINIFSGAPPELGHSFVHIGIVDLKTGDLLWMNSEYRDGASNLRDYDDANDIVDAIFDWYPGIERYRAAYID